MNLYTPPMSRLACASLCGSRSATLCEDFENGLGSVWTQTAQQGTVTIDATHVHSGANALRIHINSLAMGVSASAQLTEVATLTTANADFHLRAFVYLPAATQDVVMMQVQQGASPWQISNIEVTSGYAAQFDQFAPGAGYVQQSTKFPTGRWVCVVWDFQFGTAQTVSFDGKQFSQVGLAALNPSLGTINFGSYATNNNATPSAAVDFWMDDILVDSSPVACN
jgi:hypothetical protein